MDAHPIHIHLIQFQLVHRQQFDVEAYLNEWGNLNGQPPFNHPIINVQSLSNFLFVNTIVTPTPQERGWKDTIIANSGEAVTIRVRFAPQDGSSFPFDATAGPGYSMALPPTRTRRQRDDAPLQSHSTITKNVHVAIARDRPSLLLQA